MRPAVSLLYMHLFFYVFLDCLLLQPFSRFTLRNSVFYLRSYCIFIPLNIFGDFCCHSQYFGIAINNYQVKYLSGHFCGHVIRIAVSYFMIGLKIFVFNYVIYSRQRCLVLIFWNRENVYLRIIMIGFQCTRHVTTDLLP